MKMFKLVHHKLSASQGAASAPAEQPQNLTFQKLISSANNTTRSAEGPRTPCLSWNRVFRASLDPLKVSATVLSRNRVAPTAPPTPPLATSHVPAETFSMSIATPAAGSGANPGPGHLPQAGVEPLDSKILPGRLQNLRACLLCRLVKTEVQFAEDGCDNCPEVRLGTVAQFTSPTFQGFVGIYKPEKSWVARWQRQILRKPGLYALQVTGDLPAGGREDEYDEDGHDDDDLDDEDLDDDAEEDLDDEDE